MSVVLLGYQQIQQRIIDMLKASINPDLREKPTGPIAAYYFAEPPTKDRFPLIWVEWDGPGLVANYGPDEASEWRVNYRIVIIDRAETPDRAQKNVEDYAERIVKTLRTDTTLGGNVLESYVNAVHPLERRREESAFLDGASVLLEAVVRA